MVTSPDEANRALALSYAPFAARAGLAALLALDDALAGIVRAARDPLVGHMRLTWWYGALTGLDNGLSPAQPILAALASHALPRGATGVMLAGMVDGWEILLDRDPLTRTALADYAAARGGGLFAAGGLICGAATADPLAVAGEGWALADLARHVGNAAERGVAEEMARERLAAAAAVRWSRAGRALGAVMHGARMDLDGPARGAPRRVARLLRHRLTGR